MQKKIKTLLNYSFTLFSVVILSLSIRGFLGNPNGPELNSTTWKENGPFELSPERGRFERKLTLVFLWDMMDNIYIRSKNL